MEYPFVLQHFQNTHLCTPLVLLISMYNTAKGVTGMGQMFTHAHVGWWDIIQDRILPSEYFCTSLIFHDTKHWNVLIAYVLLNMKRGFFSSSWTFCSIPLLKLVQIGCYVIGIPWVMVSAHLIKLLLCPKWRWLEANVKIISYGTTSEISTRPNYQTIGQTSFCYKNINYFEFL